MKKFLSFSLGILCSLFSFSQAVVSSYSPTSGSLGDVITINGNGFTGVTQVTIGGVNALRYTVVSPTLIRAQVAPRGPSTTGTVTVTATGGTGTGPGVFTFILGTTGIITDFRGYWRTDLPTINTVRPDTSHNLLAFTYKGVRYSTGANDAALSSNGVTYTPANFRALPVAGITGNTPALTTTTVFMALARKIDGRPNSIYPPAVAHLSVADVLVDGANGLDLGSGVTNLPTTAILTFQIPNIATDRIDDIEPDIVITQIANPDATNDRFGFINASGTLIGNEISQNMNYLSKMGDYYLDLFRLTPNVPYNTGKPYSGRPPVDVNDSTRPIRVIAFRLSDFGITAANASQVRALRISPSGNSDYAFVAYNTNSINLSPTVNRNLDLSNTNVCASGSAMMSVIATAAGGGVISYQWQRSTDNGSTWADIANSAKYVGVTEDKLTVTNITAPENGNQYRVRVTETDNPGIAFSNSFTIGVSAYSSPTTVTVSGGTTTCLNNPVQLTSTLTGAGPNTFYQWQTNASGSFQNIPDAHLSSYVPPTDATGAISYQLLVSGGGGCTATTSTAPVTVTVAGISSTTPAEICSNGSVTLSATATSGTINWYADDVSATVINTGNTYNTPALTENRTYYVAVAGVTGCATQYRAAVPVTVYAASVGGTVDGGGVVQIGDHTTTLTVNSYIGNIVEWQSSTNNFATHTSIANTTNSLTVNNLVVNTDYRVVIKNGACLETYSTVANIIVSNILPITGGSVKATQLSNGIKVAWQAYNEQSTVRYEVERSANGSNFTRVHTLPVANNGNATNNYEWLDAQPLNGNNFYRIKEVHQNGTANYSSIVRINFNSNGVSNILIYPNPLTRNTAQIQFTKAVAGGYHISVISTSGQVLQQSRVVHSGGTTTQSLAINKNIMPGLYKILLVGPNKEKQTWSIILQ